jgi:hypothetical protein
LELDERLEQPGPWVLVDFGSWAARSLVSNARRVEPDTTDSCGAVKIARRASPAQLGHVHG